MIGACTIPDFIDARLDSVTARRITSVLCSSSAGYVVPQPLDTERLRSQLHMPELPPAGGASSAA